MKLMWSFPRSKSVFLSSSAELQTNGRDSTDNIVSHPNHVPSSTLTQFFDHIPTVPAFPHTTQREHTQVCHREQTYHLYVMSIKSLVVLFLPNGLISLVNNAQH